MPDLYCEQCEIDGAKRVVAKYSYGKWGLCGPCYEKLGKPKMGSPRPQPPEARRENIFPTVRDLLDAHKQDSRQHDGVISTSEAKEEVMLDREAMRRDRAAGMSVAVRLLRKWHEEANEQFAALPLEKKAELLSSLE
jgi:hypothetical protein